jgi:cob(I)alamin adenosyltransferase
MTVNLTRIYTRLGDSGETHLGDMSRVPKTDGRIECYGTIDELNSHVGVALAMEGITDRQREWLSRVQNDLFDLGADVSVPLGDERERLRVSEETHVKWLEGACDEANAELKPLRSFLLPGGNALAAQLHVCRTVCRRAERRGVALGDTINPDVVRYLNRLSDLLFILAREAAGGDEVLWDPKRYR